MIQSAKTLARLGARFGEAIGVLGLLERLARGNPGGLHVLMYHRIAEPEAEPDLYPGLISATPSEFEAQMEALRVRHRVISAAELVDALREG